MSNGILQFSLGMATSQFISAVSQASGALKGLVAGFTSVGAIANGVMDAINKGAALEQLHRRTSASISDLYELQKGFQAAGLSGDDVSMALFQMQKSLGGVNEMGESTPDIFRKMGLSIQQLKKENAPQQIQSILRGLNSLGTSSAVAAAEGIFGRMNAANIIQLSHSAKDFGAAMSDAADQAKNWQRIAPMFEQVHLSLLKIKSIGSGFFAGLAEGIAPALAAGMNFIESFKSGLTGIGQGIGNMFRGITEAFKEGKIGEMLDKTFAASVEFMVNMISETLGSGSFWGGIAEVMIGSFIERTSMFFEIAASLGEALIAALDTAFQKLYEEIGKTKLGTALGIGGYKAQTFDQNYADEKKKGAEGISALDSMTQYGTNMLMQGYAKMGGAISAALAKSGGLEQDALKSFWTGLMNRVPALQKTADTTPGSGDLSNEKFTYKPDFTSFEKMGFVMGGAASNNWAAETARNTAKTCSLLETTVSLLSNMGGGGAVNAI